METNVDPRDGKVEKLAATAVARTRKAPPRRDDDLVNVLHEHSYKTMRTAIASLSMEDQL